MRETPRAVTPFGGLSVFIAYLQRVGYSRQVSEQVPVHLKSQNAIDPVQTYRALLISQDEKLELIPPFNFWTLCPFGGTGYDYARDALCLPRTPPPRVQLGKNCRAMIYSWKLRAGVALEEVALEALLQDGVIEQMGMSLANFA